MTSEGYLPGTSPREIAQAAGRMYELADEWAICAADARAKAFEKARGTNITGDFLAWKAATEQTDEALFLKWQAVRRRAAWDAYRHGIGRWNYGAW